jgi:hypothetical protein
MMLPYRVKVPSCSYIAYTDILFENTFIESFLIFML